MSGTSCKERLSTTEESALMQAKRVKEREHQEETSNISPLALSTRQEWTRGGARETPRTQDLVQEHFGLNNRGDDGRGTTCMGCIVHSICTPHSRRATL